MRKPKKPRTHGTIKRLGQATKLARRAALTGDDLTGYGMARIRPDSWRREEGGLLRFRVTANVSLRVGPSSTETDT